VDDLLATREQIRDIDMYVTLTCKGRIDRRKLIACDQCDRASGLIELESLTSDGGVLTGNFVLASRYAE
jgi:hypothetical protein